MRDRGRSGDRLPQGGEVVPYDLHRPPQMIDRESYVVRLRHTLCGVIQEPLDCEFVNPGARRRSCQAPSKIVRRPCVPYHRAVAFVGRAHLLLSGGEEALPLALIQQRSKQPSYRQHVRLARLGVLNVQDPRRAIPRGRRS